MKQRIARKTANSMGTYVVRTSIGLSTPDQARQVTPEQARQVTHGPR